MVKLEYRSSIATSFTFISNSNVSLYMHLAGQTAELKVVNVPANNYNREV